MEENQERDVTKSEGETEEKAELLKYGNRFGGLNVDEVRR